MNTVSTQHLLDAAGNVAATVEIDLNDGRYPHVVHYQGRNYVLQLGRYVEVDGAVGVRAADAS